jgi:dGTPase
MIGTLVTDLIAQTELNIRTHAPQSVDDVRAALPLVAFSAEMHELNRELKSFLRTQLYRHYRVMRMSAKSQRIISDLFHAFTGNPRLLPPQFSPPDESERVRAVADYIAGMTDRYAIREHRRIFSIEDI